MGNYDVVMKRTESWRNDRFGMFIHWGIYAVPAKGEWVKSRENLTEEEYQNYFEIFTAENYNPKEWAKLAKQAGMKYAVLTTKHHDGFCLFDSKYTDYKATNTPAGRDLVKEFVDAFRAEGIKIGFYYSLIDWHHHDYPHKGDMYHPRKDDPDCTNEGRDFSRYIEYMHNQVRELCTNYGKIDILWFDFSYGDMHSEKWQATKLVTMVRSLQPSIVIDSRLAHGDKGYTRGDENYDDAPVFEGDFFNPEEYVPMNGLKDKLGRDIPWETCINSQGHGWGYVSDNNVFMGAREVIYMLVDCVSKNGNLLLNVGPNAKGEFPKEIVKLLQEIGDWMHENSESIYGCGRANLPQPEWGRVTAKDNVLYLHFFDKSAYCTWLHGISKEDIKYSVYLEDLSEVKLGDFWNEHAKKDGGLLIPLKCAKLKNPIDTVIKVFLK